jgi:hypothetical protein
MEVSQVADRVTHAFVGHQEAVEMGVSDSAALMHILSSALYTYPKLAAVREVACNGWDGHIVVGKTDVPLQITLTDTQLTIRDFGPGIPHEKIGEIYGTYGNSTKRTDSTQTGGFGLGSKAPFAVTDNFQVDSCHNGTKTIYRVSKSSMELGGKPSINKIMSLPTEETGITVTFAIKPGERSEYLGLIHEVLMLGGILASVNGQEVKEPLPLLESPTGYIITGFNGTLLSRINVRYGNVVYPVPENTGFSTEWKLVRDHMNKLHNEVIIFMAPPDSISIAPNRESLNFTEGTVKTLKALLAQFSPKELSSCEIAAKQTKAMLVNEKLAEETPSPTVFRKNISIAQARPQLSHHTGHYAFSLRQARLNFLLSQQGSYIEPDKLFFPRIRMALKKNAFPDMKLARAMYKQMKERIRDYRGHRRYTGMTAVFHKFITYPVYQAIDAVEKMDRSRLWISNGWYGELGRLKHRTLTSNEHAIGHLFQQVLIVRSKKAAEKFLQNVRRTDDWGADGYIVYVSHHHPDRVEEAKKTFEDLGFDVTVEVPEPVQRAKPSDDPNFVPAVKKPAVKRKGYLTLSQSFNGETFLLSTARENGSVAGLLDPIAYVELENKSHYCKGRWFSWFSEKESQAVEKLWGDKIAVVTSVQKSALKAKGVPDLKTFVANYVDSNLSQRPDFKRYLAFGKYVEEGAYWRDEDVNRILRNMLQHEELMKDLGIRFSISGETEMLLTFFNENRRPAMPLCAKVAEKVKESPKVKELKTKIEQSPWKSFLDLSSLGHCLETLPVDHPKTKVAQTIVRELLK